MMQRLAPALMICALALSCSPDGTEYTPLHFPEEHTADITPLNRELVMDIPSRFLLCDTVTVMNSRNADNDNIFQALSTTDGTLCASFAHMGRGANELSDCYGLALDQNTATMYALGSDSKLLAIDLHKALSGRGDFVTARYNADIARSAKNIYALGEGKILYEGLPRFSVIELSQGDTPTELFSYNEYPELPAEIASATDGAANYFYYNSDTAVKTDGTMFCNATSNGMILEIFSIGKEGIRSDAVRRIYEPNKESQNSIFGTIQAQATDRYIYLLYIATTAGSYDYATTCPELGVFDWKGHEVAHYTLGKRVVRFTVTSDDSRSYCWYLGDEGIPVYGYFDMTH